MPTLLTPTGTPSVFGGVGKLEFAPTNAPDDPFPTYVDLTPYLRTEQAPVTITRGRQTELDTIQPSQLTAVLDNTDGRFTFGNTAGAYGANWTTAKQVRYSETIGQRTFVLYKGFIEFPDIDSWQPIGYQEVALTCTDRLTRLGRGQPFVSTLTEYIRFAYPSTLTRYWPLGGTRTTYTDVVGGKTIAATRSTTGATSGAITPADGPVASADDLNCPRFTPGTTDGYRLLSGSPSTPFAAGQVLTIVAWFLPTAGVTYLSDDFLNAAIVENVGSSSLALFYGAGAFTAQLAFGALTGTISTLIALPVDVPTPIAIRYGYSPSLFEVWIGSRRVTGTLAGAPPTTSTVIQLYVGNQRYAGRIGHIQIHVGTPAAFDLPQLVAQQQMGLAGLEYQTTGQRINTILDYAGVPAGDRAVDPGVSYMQKATLAGQSPQTALQNAVTTERGRGFAAGDGRYVFHDRVRVLNV